MSIAETAVQNALKNPNGLEIAEAAAHDALVDRRYREERAWREQNGCGQFLTSAGYARMNRYVDRLMESAPEAIAYYAIRDARRKFAAIGGAA